MENSSKQKSGVGSGILPVILRPLITGVIVFAACILLFPLIMLKTDDPTAFVPAAAAATVALTSFFVSFTASRKSTVHFALAGFVCSLVIALLFFGIPLIFGEESNYGFTAVISAMSLIFSLFGAKLGRKNGRKKRKRR